MGDHSIFARTCAFLLAAFCCVVVGMAMGCGGPPDATVDVTRSLAVALHEADAEVANKYTEANDAAIEAARPLPTQEARLAAYERSMSSWEPVVHALEHAQTTLRLMESAIEAWDAGREGSESSWLSFAACLVVSLDELLHAAEDLGIRVLARLEAERDLLHRVATGRCEESLQ